jgi:hypothetical protein
VFEAELRSPNSLLLETAAEMGVRRIFIDGIGLLYPTSTVGTGISARRSRRSSGCLVWSLTYPIVRTRNLRRPRQCFSRLKPCELPCRTSMDYFGRPEGCWLRANVKAM